MNDTRDIDELEAGLRRILTKLAQQEKRLKRLRRWWKVQDFCWAVFFGFLKTVYFVSAVALIAGFIWGFIMCVYYFFYWPSQGIWLPSIVAGSVASVLLFYFIGRKP